VLAQRHGPYVADRLGPLQGRADRRLDLGVGAVAVEVVLPPAQVRLQRLVDVKPVLDRQLLAQQLVADAALPVAELVAGQGEHLVRL
jgi:hypothetical protein